LIVLRGRGEALSLHTNPEATVLTIAYIVIAVCAAYSTVFVPIIIGCCLAELRRAERR
jgi:hypothetical protein